MRRVAAAVGGLLGACAVAACTAEPVLVPPHADFTGAVAWVGAPPLHPDRRPVPPCTPDDLSVHGVPAPASDRVSLRLTYTSRKRCALFDVPSPLLLDGDGIGLGTRRGSPQPPVDVVVGPGRSAAQRLTWRASCVPGPAPVVRVRMVDGEPGLPVVLDSGLPTCAPGAPTDTMTWTSALGPDAGPPPSWPVSTSAPGTDGDRAYIWVGGIPARSGCPDVWLWSDDPGAPPQASVLPCDGHRAASLYALPDGSAGTARAVTLVGARGEVRVWLG